MKMRPILSTLIVLVLQAFVAVGVSAQAAEGQHWVTAWAMSPSTLSPAADADDAFADQTLRQIVRLSASGDQLRLRLSNAHGNKPLHLAAVTIARQTQGSAIDPSSLQTVTFSAQQHLIIPRGAVAISDVIDFDVAANTNLSISLYLPQGSGHATTHRVGLQTSYVSAAGDQSSAPAMPDDAEEITFWHFINAVDVGRREPITTIVTLGDSITDGVGSTVNTNQRWPDLLAARLAAEPGMPAFAIANAGISGNRVLHERLEIFGENLQARFERDVLALSGVSHIVLLEGINDIGMSLTMAPDQEVTAEQIIAGYRQIIARAHARGIRMIGATLTPFEGAGYFHDEGELKRQQVNQWIRSSGEFDAVIDFDAAVRDPVNSARLPAAFTSDNLHPNDAGYHAMANAIDLNIFR